jgi:hypothetical protein
VEHFDEFCYWIKEREAIRLRKELGYPWPQWSDDPIFDKTYFCNIRREEDKVTRWIRDNWPMTTIPRHTVAMAVARWVNKPATLKMLGYPENGISPVWERNWRYIMENTTTPWGNAYVVSTNGKQMPKPAYILGRLRALECGEQQLRYRTCATAHKGLMVFDGLGSFMAGQIVADLKNTEGHPLQDAPDWWTWSAHGPGSLKGMARVLGCDRVTPTQYRNYMPRIVEGVNEAKLDIGGDLHAQDVQNCLCEFDKYCRVKYTTGKSKRVYRHGETG